MSDMNVLEEIIDGCKKENAELEEALKNPSDEYIIEVQGIYVSPRFTESKVYKKPIAGRVQNGSPHKVVRFSKSEAEYYAPMVKNGNDERGKAILWTDAAKEKIEFNHRIIEMCQERIEKNLGPGPWSTK